MTFYEFIQEAKQSMSTRESFIVLGQHVIAKAKMMNTNSPDCWVNVSIGGNKIFKIGITNGRAYIFSGVVNSQVNIHDIDPESHIEDHLLGKI